ncbi:hypothetical protein C365_05252 [Cryptococcus neoformans Bt85]|nr:hypothetical protein C365_05252 [Cryptococcus neoformans var. grubii Bt85]
MPGLEPFAVIGLSLAVTGCAHFRRKDSPCHKYLVRVGQLHSTRKHPAHSGVEHSDAMLAQQCELLHQFEQAPQTARQNSTLKCTSWEVKPSGGSGPNSCSPANTFTSIHINRYQAHTTSHASTRINIPHFTFGPIMSSSTERQINATEQANNKRRSNMAVDVVLPSQKSHKKMKLSTTLPSPTSSPNSSSLPNGNTSSTTDRSPSTTHNPSPAASHIGSPVSSPTGSYISVASLLEYPMDGPEPVSLESLYVDNASSNFEDEAGNDGNVEAQGGLCKERG